MSAASVGGDADAYPVALARFGPGAIDYTSDACRGALDSLGKALGWAMESRGPLGGVIKPGARVVVKPNWVLHRNKGPYGMDCLVTHPVLIKEVVRAVLASDAASVALGDAPIQGCDFAALMAFGGIDSWAEALSAQDKRFAGPLDFRRTRAQLVGGVLVQTEDQAPLSDFVLFDLGRDSLLEPVTRGPNPFRVTQYDPDKMARTHSQGRHQYLVARALIEADVVVNLPKLKTHRKAGMTNALKNLVGINGNKEYLPHHRVGGEAQGGDCYPRRSVIKRAHERILDAQNRAQSHAVRRLLNFPARTLSVLGRWVADPYGIEGAWSGNDTVWRMCLDLNRVLLYGRPDGTLAEIPQRRVVSIVDAIIAGQGDGPLAPEPFPLGVLFAGENPAAVDEVGAGLLGLNPDRIALVRESFGDFRWPLAPSGRKAVRRLWGTGGPDPQRPLPLPQFYPAGWLDAVAPGARAGQPVGRNWHPTLKQRLTPQEA